MLVAQLDLKGSSTEKLIMGPPTPKSEISWGGVGVILRGKKFEIWGVWSSLVNNAWRGGGVAMIPVESQHTQVDPPSSQANSGLFTNGSCHLQRVSIQAEKVRYGEWQEPVLAI